MQKANFHLSSLRDSGEGEVRNCNQQKYPNICGDPENIGACGLFSWALPRLWVGYKSQEKFHIYLVLFQMVPEQYSVVGRRELVRQITWDNAAATPWLVHSMQDTDFPFLPTQNHINMERTVRDLQLGRGCHVWKT